MPLGINIDLDFSGKQRKLTKLRARTLRQAYHIARVVGRLVSGLIGGTVRGSRLVPSLFRHGTQKSFAGEKSMKMIAAEFLEM